MKYALFLIASLAYGQSELGTSAIRIMPRAADSDTGSVRFVELYSNGSNRIDLRAPQSIHANKILRVPNDNGVLVADFNSVYGTDTFTITSLVSAGTEASPSDISDGRELFKFAGYARTGGSTVQAARLLFTAETASPLQTFATVGLTNGGTFKANSYSFEYNKFWASEGQRPSLGTSAASGRWGTIYGDSADFLVPTGSAPAYETGSFVRTQTVDIYDIGGQNGGWSLTAENEVAGDSFLRIQDATPADFARFYRKLANVAVDYAEWHTSMWPEADNTRDLGNATKRWNNIHGRYVYAHTSLYLGSTYKINFATDGTMSANYSLVMPPANASGCLSNDGAGDLSWASCSGGSGSAPLDEAKITDYGAASDCSTSINSAYTSAKAALTNGGRITFPPGCYLIDASLVIGNSAGTNESTEETIYLVGAGAAYNPSGLAPNTEIRWDSGTVPGSATPMVQFSGPINAGGIEGILLNADNTANVYYVYQRHHAYGTFRNVWAKRAPTSPSWIVTTSSNTYPYGSCYNRYDQVHITNDSVSGGGGMYLTGATGSGRDACSNLFTDGEIWYDSDTAGTYGVKLDYADNNTFLRFNLFRTSNGPGGLESSYSSGSAWAVSVNTSTDQFTLGAANSAIVNGSRVRFSYTGSLPTGIQWAFPYFVINKSGNSFQVSTTSGGSAVDMTTTGSNVIVFLINPGVLLERYSGDTSFPKENAWYSSAIHNGVWSPNPPTGGNDFPEFQPDDCYVSPCIPNLDYVWGKAKGQMLGGGNTPPGVEVSHTDAQNTFRLNQSSGLNNGAGSIAFQRNATTLGRIRANYFDGLVFSTSSGGGAATERWRITDAGHWFPSSDATYTIGNISNRPDQIWAKAYRAYSNNAAGAQSHILYADHNVNIDLKAYGSTGNDYRAFINFYRARGTVASPSPVASGDRLGGMAWWYNTGSGSESMSVGARVNVIADLVSGAAGTTFSIATSTAAGSLGDRLTVNNDGSTMFYSSVYPMTDGVGALGTGSKRWSDIYLVGGDNIDCSGQCAPVVDNNDALGSTSKRWSAVHSIGFTAHGGGILPATDGVGALGGSSKRWANLYMVGGNNMDCSGQCAPILNNNDSWGSSSNRWSDVYTVNLNISGAITPPSGTAGANGTASCGTGTALKSITVSAGIVTSVTCGAP